MNLLDSLKQHYKGSNILMRLIIVNGVIFISVNLLIIITKLFMVEAVVISRWFSVPAELTSLASRFWTPLTYMFYHEQFFHVFFNMLMLFWFGRIFTVYYSERQLLGLYLLGGLCGAAFYVAGYNIFPYYADLTSRSIVMGASGSVLALIVAAALRDPQMQIRLLFLGHIRLIWIALIMVVLSFFGLTEENAGGELAHLGGAFAGYLFTTFDKKGKDVTRFISKLIDFVVSLFRPKPKLKTRKYHAQKLSPEEYNQKKAHDKAENEREIDRILDKIKLSGYESLSADEKRKLFDQKK